jgi:hypothetical protein
MRFFNEINNCLSNEPKPVMASMYDKKNIKDNKQLMSPIKCFKMTTTSNELDWENNYYKKYNTQYDTREWCNVQLSNLARAVNIISTHEYPRLQKKSLELFLLINEYVSTVSVYAIINHMTNCVNKRQNCNPSSNYCMNCNSIIHKNNCVEKSTASY